MGGPRVRPPAPDARHDQWGRGAETEGSRLQVEGGHVDHRQLPLRGPPPADGDAGGDTLKFFPRGLRCVYQGTHQPGAPSLFRVGHHNTVVGQPLTCRVRQGKEREGTFPLPQPQARVIGSQPRWSRVIGMTSAEICVQSDGKVFSASTPGPLGTSDLVHVALAAETGGGET